MRWLRGVSRFARRIVPGRKSFSGPAFWDLDRFRAALGLGSTPDKIRIENDVAGYSEGAYKANSVVFACAQTRQLVFSEARLQWQEIRDGRPGRLFGTPELDLFESPWPGGTTGELLSLMDAHVTIAGNFYATTADDSGRSGKAASGPSRRVCVMRPDWVTLVIDSASGDPYAVDAKVVGYIYEPPLSGTRTTRSEPLLLRAGEVCHYSPYPDPLARFRGMSWLTPALREVSADLSATRHKQSFLDRGATLQTIARLPKEIGSDAFERFVQLFKAEHEGADNAYKTLFLGGGADVSVVGADLRQLDFKNVQGAGESRIAAASGVHPTLVGLSEGLQGSALNSGNFNAAKRLTADKTFRPLWRIAAASLQTLVTPPTRGKVRLWYDDRDVAFLRDDMADVAQVQANQAAALTSLIQAGWKPDAAVEFLRSDDLSRLIGEHSGMATVQLQPIGSIDPGGRPALTNGSANGQQAALTR